MPRGKELEQLPNATIIPGTGKDKAPYNREILGGVIPNEQPKPSEIEKENEDMI